jgi:hypothetical protein
MPPRLMQSTSLKFNAHAKHPKSSSDQPKRFREQLQQGEHFLSTNVSKLPGNGRVNPIVYLIDLRRRDADPADGQQQCRKQTRQKDFGAFYGLRSLSDF